jgi:2-haloacid dehalogenase
MPLTDYQVLTFDCYGTLIDWETGMIQALSPLTARAAQAGVALARDQVLQAHARHESSLQHERPELPYSALLALVYGRLAAEWGVPASAGERDRYGCSVRHWPAFADSAGALQYLKQHYKLVILSNVDNASFAFSNARLQVQFDAVHTAQDIGSYKPSPRNFQYLLDALGSEGIGRGQVLHVAESLFHDHAPANAFGLASCWIHRRHGQDGFGATMDPGSQPRVDFRFTSMAELVQAHRQALLA